MPSDSILVADHVHRHYAGVTAVDVERVAIPRGKITALIGPNGAGKTTFFNLLTGFDKPQTGTWTFDGVRLDGRAPWQVARHGMVRTFQLTKVLGRLTVLENMLLGAKNRPGERLLTFWRGQDRSDLSRAREILARFKLDAKADDYAASLSGGQRKLLEMARAIMYEPRMVMLDEPMAGVNPALTQSLLHHIKDLKEQGMTVLFVEHDMHMVRYVADRVVVMAEGKIIAEGEPAEVLSSAAVVDAYLGAHHDTDLRELIRESES